MMPWITYDTLPPFSPQFVRPLPCRGTFPQQLLAEALAEGSNTLCAKALDLQVNGLVVYGMHNWCQTGILEALVGALGNATFGSDERVVSSISIYTVHNVCKV
jgi:hypothetical protein